MDGAVTQVTAQFSPALELLFQPARYKVMYGGRGAGRSWGCARALLIRGAQATLRVLCARELQNSIEESVHKLLSDQIQLLGLDKPECGAAMYVVEKRSIYNTLGTTFAFEGISRNVNKIRSIEGVDICWVEEANKVSKNSWNVLIPTIRKSASEIWITFNPELETDETYQRFVISPPSAAKVIKMNWRENPWFPDVLRDEMEDLKRRDFDDYLHVWEGHCKQVLEGAVYAKELRNAEADGRLTKVIYDKASPVHTFWDLGRADATAIWFIQFAGIETHVIDFFKGYGEDLPYYLGELQGKRYLYGSHNLPHDAKAKRLGTKHTIEEQVREAYPGIVKIVPKLSIADGINAGRMLMSKSWFDKDKCSDGINDLRHYRFEVGQDGQFSQNPLHDDASHAADAWRYAGVGLKNGKNKKKFPDWKENLEGFLGFSSGPSQGWLR